MTENPSCYLRIFEVRRVRATLQRLSLHPRPDAPPTSFGRSSARGTDNWWSRRCRSPPPASAAPCCTSGQSDRARPHWRRDEGLSPVSVSASSGPTKFGPWLHQVDCPYHCPLTWRDSRQNQRTRRSCCSIENIRRSGRVLYPGDVDRGGASTFRPDESRLRHRIGQCLAADQTE